MSTSAWSDWMESLLGGGSRRTYAATFPPDRYFCILDELPMHLIPQSAIPHHADLKHDVLAVNENCVLSCGCEVPAVLNIPAELLSKFALQGTIAWIRNSASASVLPFWLSPQLADAVQRVKADQSAITHLSKETQNLLLAAGILVASDSLRHYESRGQDSARLFSEKSYAPLPGLIHPFHVAALRRYYRYLIRSGAVRLGDGQSSRRYAAHNEPVARFFHHQLVSRLSNVFGLAVKPSYVYMASYLPGAELKKHVDREQCEFSVTFCLDFSPEPGISSPWPILLDTPSGRVAVYQGLGDGLAYRGTRVPHYRSALKEGCTSTSIFFHYVGSGFIGSLD